MWFRFFTKKKLSSTLQQRVCIKFCVKNGFNGGQTLEMLEKCFDNDTLMRSNIFCWHERFRSGRESVENDERSGRPSTAKTDENINKIIKRIITGDETWIYEYDTHFRHQASE